MMTTLDLFIADAKIMIIYSARVVNAGLSRQLLSMDKRYIFLSSGGRDEQAI
jgi:hypothetical protein